LYSLLYGTRSKEGIEVWDCQIAALEEQSRTPAAVKVGHAQTTSGQGEIFYRFTKWHQMIYSNISSRSARQPLAGFWS